MWTAFGIFLGTAINIAVYNMRENWRYMIGAPFIPAVPLLCLIYLCPESPRWYIKKNRYVNAWNSLIHLRNHPIQVARDIYVSGIYFYTCAYLSLRKYSVAKCWKIVGLGILQALKKPQEIGGLCYR